jgi:hypothetical protein
MSALPLVACAALCIAAGFLAGRLTVPHADVAPVPTAGAQPERVGSTRTAEVHNSVTGTAEAEPQQPVSAPSEGSAASGAAPGDGGNASPTPGTPRTPAAPEKPTVVLLNPGSAESSHSENSAADDGRSTVAKPPAHRTVEKVAADNHKVAEPTRKRPSAETAQKPAPRMAKREAGNQPRDYQALRRFMIEGGE